MGHAISQRPDTDVVRAGQAPDAATGAGALVA